MGDTTAVLNVSSAWLRERKKLQHELTGHQEKMYLCKSYYTILIHSKIVAKTTSRIGNCIFKSHSNPTHLVQSYRDNEIFA
jgi:hypothetical protein